MEAFEAVLLLERPHLVLVVGDVNSTLACALVAKKFSWSEDSGGAPFIPKLAHVEAGLRSFDRAMPEEINRMVTDALSDYLFTTEESANQNLIREGIPTERIHFVGNVMIDTLLRHRAKAEASAILSDLRLSRNGTKPDQFAVLTLHRPGNVEDKVTLCRILEALLEITRHVPVIFPAHPRTVKKLHEWNLGDFFVTDSVERENRRRGIRLIPPLGYLDFLKLMSHARVILTDSGGIQEEATVLGVPCLTLRDNTERPVTITQGTNVLVGAADPRRLVEEFEKVLHGERKAPTSPVYWDGKAAQRIVKILVEAHFGSRSIHHEGHEEHEGL
jgi:UDP-N-acetylglucosamine 2-epimerase (non-hydrolysing)